jgi:hypothetical protein
MDRGRATCGGQKPTAPTTRLIRGYSRINAYYPTRLGLHPTRESVEAPPSTYISMRGQGAALGRS